MGSFLAASWNILFTSVFVLRGLQLFVLLSRCSSFYFLNLLSAKQFLTIFNRVYHFIDLTLNVFFILLFGMCSFSLCLLKFLLVGIFWIFFIMPGSFCNAIPFFFRTASVSLGTLCLAVVWLVCIPLLLPFGCWRSFRIRHSDQVIQISPEEYRICFLQLPYIHCWYLY